MKTASAAYTHMAACLALLGRNLSSRSLPRTAKPIGNAAQMPCMKTTKVRDSMAVAVWVPASFTADPTAAILLLNALRVQAACLVSL